MGDMARTGGRSYGQFCPIAAGLDLLGDRWVLLVCRELAMGDRRFTDLRRALPGIAPNLLSERLRTLQGAGLVTVATLPPPAARQVYRLTPEGERVRPVLGAMARFGAHHLGEVPADGFSAERAARALLVPWARTRGERFRLRLALDGADPVDVVVGEGCVDVETSGEAAADAVLRCGLADLVAARRGDAVLVGAIDAAPEQRVRALTTFHLDLPDVSG